MSGSCPQMSFSAYYLARPLTPLQTRTGQKLHRLASRSSKHCDTRLYLLSNQGCPNWWIERWRCHKCPTLCVYKLHLDIFRGCSLYGLCSSLRNLDLFIMGKLVKLLGSGIGFTSEVIHAARARSRSQSEQTLSSGSHVSPATDSPRYAEGADEGAANVLARSERLGHYDDNQMSKASEAGYASDSDSSDVDDLGGFHDDEAAWELDEMAERMLPPTYEEATITSPTESPTESENMKVKNEEAMVQDLVRRAGPTPQPVQRLPCPVILPQRRPRQKDRGFVRAYAPILAECGIGQDVFLQFLEAWDKASKVRLYLHCDDDVSTDGSIGLTMD